MAQGRRGWFLSVVAVLYALLAISNFLKPVMANAHTGFVFFGHRLSGLPNDILGPLFGIFLLALAILIWRMHRLAVPVAWAYAAYVAANGILFSIVERAGAAASSGAKNAYGTPIQAIFFMIVGIGVPVAAAVVLTRRRTELA